MTKARLHVLRSSEPKDAAPRVAAVDGVRDLDQGLIAESEIWSMAAFRLHDAATWMVRLATASGSTPLRVHLLRIYDALIRDEQDLLQRAEDRGLAAKPPPEVPAVNGQRKPR